MLPQLGAEEVDVLEEKLHVEKQPLSEEEIRELWVGVCQEVGIDPLKYSHPKILFVSWPRMCATYVSGFCCVPHIKIGSGLWEEKRTYIHELIHAALEIEGSGKRIQPGKNFVKLHTNQMKQIQIRACTKFNVDPGDWARGLRKYDQRTATRDAIVAGSRCPKCKSIFKQKTSTRRGRDGYTEFKCEECDERWVV